MNLYIRIDEKASQSFKSICASKHINMSGYIAKRIEESVRTGFIPVDIEKPYKKLNRKSMSISKICVIYMVILTHLCFGNLSISL